MGNSNTEHSKNLRRKTALEWNKKRLEERGDKRVNVILTADYFEKLDEVAKEKGNRTAALRFLLDFYFDKKN